MANIIVNPTPKTRLQSNQKFLEKHREFLSTEELARGVDAALLQYQWELAQKVSDQYGAMSMGLRLLGAQEFVAKLWDLGVIPEQRKLTVSDNLDHRV